MKNRSVSKIILFNLFVLFINLHGAIVDDFEILKDYKGFALPNIKDYTLVKSTEESILVNNVKKKVVLNEYELADADSIMYRDVILVNSKFVKRSFVMNNDSIGKNNDFVRYSVKSFTVCYLKNNSEILYYNLSLFTDYLTDSKIVKDSLFLRKLNGKIGPESLGPISSYRSYFGDIIQGIVFDSDSDGNFESLFFYNYFSIEGESEEAYKARNLNTIVNYVSNKKSEELQFKSLIHAWGLYRNKPTSENAETFLKAIPDEPVDKTGICFHPDFSRLKKRFENEKFLTPDEKIIWTEIENNLNFIKRQAYLGKPNAVRILFKLYRIFYKSYLFQSKLDLIMDELSLLKTDLFLKILMENRDLDFSVLLDMYIGLDFLNKTNDRYENIENKIMIFEKIDNPDLLEIRNECISVLKKLKTEIERSGLLIN